MTEPERNCHGESHLRFLQTAHPRKADALGQCVSTLPTMPPLSLQAPDKERSADQESRLRNAVVEPRAPTRASPALIVGAAVRLEYATIAGAGCFGEIRSSLRPHIFEGRPPGAIHRRKEIHVCRDGIGRGVGTTARGDKNLRCSSGSSQTDATRTRPGFRWRTCWRILARNGSFSKIACRLGPRSCGARMASLAGTPVPGATSGCSKCAADRAAGRCYMALTSRHTSREGKR